MMSKQMDAESKKEQIGTLFVWVGALEGGLGGGWSFRVVHPRNWTCLPKIKTKHASVHNILFEATGTIYSSHMKILSTA